MNTGVVFQLHVDGSNFRTLKSFTGPDGSAPGAGVVLSGSTLYGSTLSGGPSGNGVIFRMPIPAAK